MAKIEKRRAKTHHFHQLPTEEHQKENYRRGTGIISRSRGH